MNEVFIYFLCFKKQFTSNPHFIIHSVEKKYVVYVVLEIIC